MANDLFTVRKSLDQICAVPDKIISVYSLEQHVWAESNSADARKSRRPDLKTIEEFQIDPVRPFLNDILRNIAAPYHRDRKENPIGQGYWIQAEFGSGKSHLLSFLSAVTLGDEKCWQIIQDKEKKAGRGKRESLFRFWEDGLEKKSKGKGSKGIFVIVKTLVGTGGGAAGISSKGRKLTEYILEAAREQLLAESGKSVSLFPAELLADRFLNKDLDLLKDRLRKYLRDPAIFEEDEQQDLEDFLRDLQQGGPDYKESCGKKLWDFYHDYIHMDPQIGGETEGILKNMVEQIMAEGYSGILLVLDEVSLYMKNRDEDQRTDDEATLVVLSNRLAKVHNLPIWTVCSAQQAIESKLGVKNIIADDRLKLVKLLEEDVDYYKIVLNRVRELVDPEAISAYYLHYKRGFSWPNSISENEFREFFPFHKPALEVLRAVTYELTTARSAIHFMHQTLKHQIKSKGKELIRLWELFDEAVRYEEDPSGVHAGIVAIKTKKETEYKAYEACRRQIEALTKGYLKVNRDKAIKTVQTLFLYHVARTRQQGLSSEEIANSVLIERAEDSNIDENNQHYETLADNLKKELRQIVQSIDEDGRPRFRFDPVFTGVDPRDEFQKACDEAEANEAAQQEAWNHLLALDTWPVRTRQMTLDLSGGVNSIFREISPWVAPWESRDKAKAGDQEEEISWQGREVFGMVGMRDIGRLAGENLSLPPIDSDETDRDFAVYVGIKPCHPSATTKLLALRKDPRVLIWTPGELTHEEKARLVEFAAYRKLVSTWSGQETEDAMAVINWVANSLQTGLAKIKKIVDNSYARGRIDAYNNAEMEFHVAGDLQSILTPLIGKVLTATYESRDIRFEPPFKFRREEGVKLINGIVKTGSIPKGAKPNQNISAAQNFGFGLMVMKKSAEKDLDISDNRFVKAIWDFIDDKLVDEGQTMRCETIYKNFMGIGGSTGDYGLTRRMVQIYLLCMVHEGKIRILVSPKAGLAVQAIDYANKGEIEFSAKILDSFQEVQKVAKPENWEVLRPYAEMLLNEEIPPTHDDSVISRYRAKLIALFDGERDESLRIRNKATSLFSLINVANPYEVELEQANKLFSHELSGGKDIDLTLFALKQAFGFKAFDQNAATISEVDDLAVRLKNYRDVKRFLTYESELITASEYCKTPLPDSKEFKRIRQIQADLSAKLQKVQPYIDSEVAIKTELIGAYPAAPGDKGTLGLLRSEYGTLYSAIHDSVTNRIEEAHSEINAVLNGDRFKALAMLEGVTALQPRVSGNIASCLHDLLDSLFSCPNPSHHSLEEELRRRPIHSCQLTFANASDKLQHAESVTKKAADLFEASFRSKIEVLLTPAIRERLRQGESEASIKAILQARDGDSLAPAIVALTQSDPELVETINRYLKKIVVKSVRLSDFRPSSTTIEEGQIKDIAKEFERFLDAELRSIDSGEDGLPILQVE